MEDKLKKDVEVLIKAIFSEKEEAAQKQRTEEALQTSANTIDELTTALEEKSSELVTSEESISELTKTVEDLRAELEAAKAETASVNDKLTSVEAEMEKMLKDKAMEVRMVDLEKAGVIRKDREAQAEKVREMSEEAFVTYKEELVSVREAVMAELATAKQEAEEKAEADKIAAEAAAKEAEEKAAAEKAAAEAAAADDAGDNGTPPVNVDPAQAAQAALNLELSSNDIKDKYAKLGQAMASMLTKHN